MVKYYTESVKISNLHNHYFLNYDEITILTRFYRNFQYLVFPYAFCEKFKNGSFNL